MTFFDYLSLCQEWVNHSLQQAIEQYGSDHQRLRDAMLYSTMAGGKRVRPLLARASCEALGGSPEQVAAAACAVELIHTYSLIHDDLPAMDDDDLRRGRPTCHRAFDEATAILAGDALLTLAFEVIADNPALPAEVRLEQSRVLACAAGGQGMVSGQIRDMQATGQQLELEQLQALHQRKTGALISAACTLGGLAAGASEAQLEALQCYSQAIGLAFQVQDDILDVTASTEELGKAQGADVEQGKNTYVSLLGLNAARSTAHELQQQALIALEPLGPNTQQLQALAQYIVSRGH